MLTFLISSFSLSVFAVILANRDMMCIGESARAWLQTVQIDYHALSVEQIMQAIEEKCTATTTEVLRDFKFFSSELDQKKSESFNTFYERIRAKSRVCKFGQVSNRLVRSRIIIGLRDEDLRETLLAAEWSLVEVVTKCRSAELGERNAMQISKPYQPVEAIAAIDTQQSQPGVGADVYGHDADDPRGHNITPWDRFRFVRMPGLSMLPMSSRGSQIVSLLEWMESAW